MKFHFYTKDFRLDYPEIGWIPKLDNQPWDKWKRFHQPEFPELILFQNNGNWTLYVSALNSGRRDHVNRINRLSFVITGNVHEDNGTELTQFMSQVVSCLGKVEVLTNDSFVSQLSYIKQGDPEKWSSATLTEQTEVANELGKTILNSPTNSQYQWSQQDKWYGGNNDESRSAFLQSCLYLLTNPVKSGVALSLIKLGPEHIEQDYSLSEQYDKFAILLTDAVTITPMPKKEEPKTNTHPMPGPTQWSW